MLKNQALRKSKKIRLATKTLTTKSTFLKISKSIMLFFEKTAISLKKTIVVKAK